MSKKGEAVMALVDDYAAVMKALEERSGANASAMLRRSLNNALGDLRKAYNSYMQAVGPLEAGPDGKPGRRPGAYSAGEVATKFKGILKASQQFLRDEELKGWQEQFEDDLLKATTRGGEISDELQKIVAAKPKAVPFAAPDPLAVRAALQITTAYIEGEAASFRDSIVQTVGEGVSRGWGPRKLEKRIREALMGSKDPNGITQRLGLSQRAALIARSELANAYVRGGLERSKRQGFAYVRVVAAMDERSCPTCVSRNGLVFRVDQLVLPFHPRCRCVPVPVSREAVEEEDAEQRDLLLDGEFWREEHQRGVEAFAAAKGIKAAEAGPVLAKALEKPTASEKRLQPGIERSLKAAAGLGGARKAESG
jgi:SPP1 gp7 family putative phage head morphogenesis protein